MRFEAKHSYFKSLAHRVKCFKNIPKTLAVRHQHLMCYTLSNPTCSPFVKDMKTGKGIAMYVLNPVKARFIQDFQWGWENNGSGATPPRGHGCTPPLRFTYSEVASGVSKNSGN